MTGRRVLPPRPARVREGGLSQYTLVEETVTVDGVAYDAEKIKTLVLERHRLAHEIIELRSIVATRTELSERADDLLRRQGQLEARVDELATLAEEVAQENAKLRDRLRRAGRHLQLRTAALSRLIAQTSKMHVEWKHAVAGGGGSVHRTREAALEAQRQWEEARSRLWIDVPRPQPSVGIRTRLATGWRRP